MKMFAGKMLSGLAIAALGSVSLIGATQAQEQVNLTWQMWGAQDDMGLWQEIADLVTAEYPNITVTPQISGWTDYWTRLPVLAASGQLGDIVTMQSMRMPSFYEIFEPLDAHIEGDGFDLGQYESSIIAGLSHDGVQYALPYDVGPWMVFYNREMFAEAGVEEPADDWTFEDFRETAIALTEDGRYGYANQMFDFIAGPIALGAEYFDDSDQFDVTNEGYASAVKAYADLVAVDQVSPVFMSGSSAITGGGHFTAGNAAMYIDGPWTLIQAQRDSDFDIGVAPLPRGEGESRYIAAGSGYGIAANSEHKEEAYLALQVLTGPDASEILARAGRALPAWLDAQTYWYDVAAADVDGARETLEYMFAHTTPFRINTSWNDFENLMTQYLPLALNGSQSAEQVLADVQSQLP